VDSKEKEKTVIQKSGGGFANGHFIGFEVKEAFALIT
jgi:hypothetical protein